MNELKVFIKVSCGVGMSYASVHDCSGMSDDEIDDMAWEMAIDCAESFGTYYGEDIEAADEDCDDMFHGGRNFTNEDLDCSWEKYNPEKHDQLL